MSTFIVECDPGDLGPRRPRHGRRGGEPQASASRCSRTRSTAIRSSPTGRSGAAFPGSWNGRWSYRNYVLIGDALHTAHYSIGSGTRLAIEDALALAKALEAEPGDLQAGLARYEASRRPIVEKLVAASRMSAAWYDRFAEHMRLAAARSRHELHHALGPHRRRTGCGRCRRGSWRAMMRAPDDGGGHERGSRCGRMRCRAMRRARRRSASRLPSATTPAPSCSTTWARAAASAAPSPGRRDRAPTPSWPRMPTRFGAGLLSLGLQRGRPRAAVPRRHAGLSGGAVRRDPRRARAAADQHADAAGPAAVLSRRFRGDGCDLRCGLRRPVQCRRPATARGSRRWSSPTARRQRRPGGDAAAAALARRGRRRRSLPADTHRDDMAFWMYSSGSTGRPKGIVHLQHDMAYTHASYARHLLRLSERDVCFSVPEDLLRLWARQLDHLSVRGRRIERPAAGPAASPAAIFDVHRPLPADRVLRPADALHRRSPRRPRPRRPTSPACALPCRPPRCCRPRCSTPGRRCRASRSWRAWAPPRCCTSTSPTRAEMKQARRRRQARAGLRGGAPRQRRARGGATARRASCGCAATPTAPATGTGPTRPPRPCARAAGSTPATASCAMPTASISSAAAPTTSSRCRGSGSTRWRWSCASPTTRPCASAPCWR